MKGIASPLAGFHPGNALTYASLLAGLGAVAAALAGSIAGAGALTAAAVICDTFDGRFARRFSRSPAQRDLGAQLDSLSDAVTFGLVPVACTWVLWEGPGVASAFAGGLYVACAVTRLAFFNVTHGDAHDGFVGLPVPVAALIWATALLAYPGASFSIALLAVTAAGMVLPLRIPRPHGLRLAVFACWPALVCAGHLLYGA